LRLIPLPPKPLRLFVGVRLIHEVIDNVISWDRMLDFKVFLEANNFPAQLACAVVSAYAQLISGVLVIIVWKIRIAAAIMMINFCNSFNNNDQAWPRSNDTTAGDVFLKCGILPGRRGQIQVGEREKISCSIVASVLQEHVKGR
jgi:hypothetical protein